MLHGLLHLLGYDHVGEIEGDWLVVRFRCSCGQQNAYICYTLLLRFVRGGVLTTFFFLLRFGVFVSSVVLRMQMAQMENRFMKQLGWKGEGLVSAAQQPFYKKIVEA